MDIAIPTLVFGSVVMLSLALRAIFVPRTVDRRLSRLGASAQPADVEGESLVHGNEKGWARIFDRIGKRQEGEDLHQGIESGAQARGSAPRARGWRRWWRRWR